jgi:Sec-independent protein translocase protein TatA
MVQPGWVMFGLSRGEFALVLFIFVLVWGAGWLPTAFEKVFAGSASKRGESRGS